jgi:NAD(P)H dehydrogenase (quinone)
MKLSIVYHSISGNTKKIAEIMADAVGQINGIEAKAISIDAIDEEFINDSTAVIFGSPVYCGTFTWQMKKFLDTSLGLKLQDKLAGVFMTENYIGGGADLAELSLIGCLLVRGMIVYSAGAMNGDPFTHLGAVTIKDGDEYQIERAKVFAQRIAKKAIQLFG